MATSTKQAKFTDDKPFDESKDQTVDELVEKIGGTSAKMQPADTLWAVARALQIISGVANRGISDDQLQALQKNDMKYLMTWEAGKCLNLDLSIGSPADATYQVTKIKLPAGTTIDYTTKVSPTTVAMALGTSTTINQTFGTTAETALVSGTYTLINDSYVYFQSQQAAMGDSHFYIDVPSGTTFDSTMVYPGYHRGFVASNGALVDDSVTPYVYSDIIELGAYEELTARLKVSPNAAAICTFQDDGTTLDQVCEVGFGKGYAYNYNYVASKPTKLRICTRFDDDLPFEQFAVRVKSYTAKSSSPHWAKIVTTATAFGEGYIGTSDNAVHKEASPYRYSASMLLMPGQTLRFYAAGSSSTWLLSEWDLNMTNFVEGITPGDGKYHLIEYTAEKYMYVRVCGKVKQSSGIPYVDPSDFTAPLVYFKDLFYAGLKSHPLYGKSVLLIGDSLAYGNKTGPDSVWLHSLALKYGWTESNRGINGNAVSNVFGGMGIPMCQRYVDIVHDEPSADIIIVEGGANDANNDAPIGTITDTTGNTFYGAINVLIDGLRKQYPKGRLLFMTTFLRYGKESPYADAMVAACRAKAVPCFDNCHNSGLTFLDDSVKAQIDEGVWLGINADQHFSPDAYKLLAAQYETWLYQYAGSFNL